MREFVNLEQWCPSCDRSSKEVRGQYISHVWRCDDCIAELEVPHTLSREKANEKLEEIIKGLE